MINPLEDLPLPTLICLAFYANILLCKYKKLEKLVETYFQRDKKLKDSKIQFSKLIGKLGVVQKTGSNQVST